MLLSALTACAGNDLLVQRQTSMEGRLEQIMQAQNLATARIAELSGQQKELQDQLKKLKVADNSAEPEQAALQTKLAAIINRLDRLEGDTAGSRATRIELVNSEADAQNREEKVQAAYMQAFGLFSANNYQEAAKAFELFIETYPESEHASNARYWLGECYFAEGLFKKAIQSFEKVTDMKYPGNKAPEALLKTGFAWYGLDDPEKGGATLRALIDKYPESEAAGKAREKLGKQ
jgi:tol-pal system protein YbgF